LSAQNTTVARIHFDGTGRQGPSGGESRIHLVRGVTERTLDTLVEGFAAADHLRALSGVVTAAEGVTADLLMERLPFGEDAARELRQLSQDLLRHVLGEDGPDDEALDQRASALRAAVRRALEEGGKSAEGLKRQKSERLRLLEEVASLLREVALELLGTDVALGIEKSGDARLVSEPVTSPAAHVRLLPRLFARLELSLLGHELLGLEREASRWWFEKWSVEATPAGEFARRIREQEWSLAERGTLFMGPVLDNYIGRGFAARLPDRQRRLAQALQASFPGIFVVRDRRNDIAVFQDVETSRRIEVHEHDSVLDYGEGWIGLGRLYAFDGPIHLRSPGMALLEGEDERLAARLGEAFRRGRRQLAPALALETLVSALTRDVKIPRTISPARSSTEARHLVERATNALSAVGLVEDTEGAPTDSSTPAGAQPRTTRRYKVDATMGQWLGDLLDLSEKAPRPGQARAKASARKGKRKG
jgi:hypothetical protein